MFDIGFFELLVIAVVGLVVIGPERLPGAIRSAAMWWGRIKRSLRETRTELEKQLGADDIRRELHNEEVMRSLEALRAARDDLEEQIKYADQANTQLPEPSSPELKSSETGTNSTPDDTSSAGAETSAADTAAEHSRK